MNSPMKGQTMKVPLPARRAVSEVAAEEELPADAAHEADIAAEGFEEYDAEAIVDAEEVVEVQPATRPATRAAVAEPTPAEATPAAEVTSQKDGQLAPLFADPMASDFRTRWNLVQQGFVDDPGKAVREGDRLVAQVIEGLSKTFGDQRAALEAHNGSTEDLRLALRRYRSFFERLLAA